jgi:hypothetical protein
MAKMKRMAILLCIFAVVYAIVVLWVFPKWTIDDAYIAYRYAENLVHHGELTWNIGEDPVEGYTGIVLPLFLAAMIKGGISPVLGGKLIGIFSFFLGGLVLWGVLRKLGVREFAVSILLILYFTAPFMFPNALNGIETMLFGTMVLACFLALLTNLNASRNQTSREIILLSSLLFTSLIRPEGVSLAAIFIVALWAMRLQEKSKRFPALLVRSILLYVLPFLIYWVWKWQYYGQFLPNTFYVKHAGSFHMGNVNWLFSFLLRYLGIPLFGCLLFCVLSPGLAYRLLKERRMPSARPQLFIPYAAMAAFLGMIAFEYSLCVLAMNYYYRFFVPFFLLALVALGIFGELAFRALEASLSKKAWKYRVLFILMVILALVQAGIYVRDLESNMEASAAYKQLLEDEHIQVGLFIRENVPSSEWLTVHNDAGAIPYFAGLKTVDFGGINDEFLSKTKLSGSGRANYFYSFNPGVAVFTSYRWDVLDGGPMSNPISDDPRFEQYVLVRKYRTTAFKNYYQFVYFRRDLVAKVQSSLASSSLKERDGKKEKRVQDE